MIYLIIYILGSVFTGLFVYILLIKKYLREQSSLKFSTWLEAYDFAIISSSIFWFVILPIMIIVYPVTKIIKKINKHYNVEL